jgi:hypothetical protein
MTDIDTTNLETTLVEDIESEEIEVTVESTVQELVETVFGTDETISPYKVHKIVNGTFEVLGNTKRIPPQMMYNYSRNGMLVKGEKGIKELNKSQVTEFVTKFVTKHNS